MQEKTYQKIESLFSSNPSLPESSPPSSSLSLEETQEGEAEREEEKGEIPVSIKNSIPIECQGKRYAYHLGEVLRKKWKVSDALHPSSSSETGDEPSQEIQKGGSRYFFGGAEDDVAVVAKTEPAKTPELSFQLRFCLFTIHTETIVPFLKFWMVPAQESGVMGFPETTFVPSSSSVNEDENMGTEDEEEEHADFLDACRKKFMEMGIFREEQEEAFDTEFMETNYHGYIMSPKEEKVVYVFYQISPPPEVVGIGCILDEMLNHSRVLDTPVDTRIHSLFYAYPEILYIYGSPVNPIDALIYGEDSEYDSTDEVAQEIPYCLYLCQDKAELSEEVQEGKAVETPAGKVLGLEEEHYLSPKDKYRITKKMDETGGTTSVTTPSRTEDEHGFFYYFTNENLEGEWKEGGVVRYAVFVYNTDYRLDKHTWNVLKSLKMDKRLVGGEHWKWNFSMEDWMKGGGILDSFSFTQSETQEEEDKEAMEPEEKEEEEPEDKVYASVYFQRDGVPLWCIKHSLCFIALD